MKLPRPILQALLSLPLLALMCSCATQKSSIMRQVEATPNEVQAFVLASQHLFALMDSLVKYAPVINSPRALESTFSRIEDAQYAWSHAARQLMKAETITAKQQKTVNDILNRVMTTAGENSFKILQARALKFQHDPTVEQAAFELYK
jgi:hypothetical protein